MRWFAFIGIVLLAGFLSSRAVTAGDDPAKLVFGAASHAAPGPSAPIGSYAGGCLAGGVMLAEDGPGWAAMRLSRGRNWGHPALVEFIGRLADEARAAGYAGILVGDMAQPRGGPMLSGHRSHQIGLDVDLWLRPMAARPTAAERESWSSFDTVTGRHSLDEAKWAASLWPMIGVAARDPAVARIFVNPAIKRALCEATEGTARDWLRKVRPWWGHDSHFHVRLACPDGADACTDQQPPPAGDGCGAGLDWWFTDKPYTAGGGKPRPDLTLDDLPEACAAIATAP